MAVGLVEPCQGGLVELCQGLVGSPAVDLFKLCKDVADGH
jgi:hypothetical protein